MKTKLILLLLLFATACTFQVQVFNTPTPQPTQPLLAASATPTSLISVDLSATPLPLPTFTATNPALLAPAGNTNIIPIQFAPNGTYADVIDSISAGKSKTYSISAMKGQVMSVSIHQNEQADWTYFIVTVIGEDGTGLCATDCQFWRGVLPSTQNYLVTITASSDASDFVTRLAINPPGSTTQSFLYENKYRSASFSYTDIFAPAFFPGAQVSKIEPELTLEFIDTQSYIKTNLNEVYFLFGSSTDSQIISTCTQPISFGAPETIVGDTTFNGVSFTKSQATGVGAGNFYEQVYYRTVQNGVCYEFTEFIHSSNIGNYTPGTVKEFDRAGLFQKFDEILNTVMFK